MLTTRQPVLRRSRHATERLDAPGDRPEPFTPMGDVRAHHRRARYGYARACLGEPLGGIPGERDPAQRHIVQLHEDRPTSAVRPMENASDDARFAFARRATFGLADQPVPGSYDLVETEGGRIGPAQILCRDDRGEDGSTAGLIAWDAVITEEDRDMLESTDPDATVDMGRRILPRRHGEREVSEAVPHGAPTSAEALSR